MDEDGRDNRGKGSDNNPIIIMVLHPMRATGGMSEYLIGNTVQLEKQGSIYFFHILFL